MNSSRSQRKRTRALVLGLLVAMIAPMLSGCDIGSLLKTLGPLLTSLGGALGTPAAGAKPAGTPAAQPVPPALIPIPGGAPRAN